MVEELGLEQTEGSLTSESEKGEGSHTSNSKNDEYKYTQKELDSREIKIRKKYESKMERMKEDLLNELKMETATEVEKMKFQLEKLTKENSLLMETNKSMFVKQKQFEVQSLASKLNAVDPELVWLSLRDDVLGNDEINIEKQITGLLKQKPHLVKSTMPQGGAGSKSSNAAPQAEKVDLTKKENRVNSLRKIYEGG